MNSVVHQLPVNQPVKMPGRSEPPITPVYHQLPEAGFLRLNQIVKVPGSSEPPIIPISRTSFLNGVKSGKYPPGILLGERTRVWPVEDIRKLIVELGGAA